MRNNSSDKKLYFKLDKPAESLKELIDALFTSHIDGRRQVTAKATFEDEAFGNCECFSARRSFEDLLVISRTYFPNTTEVELMQVLKDLDAQFWYCSDVRKFVFFFNGGGHEL